MEKMSRKPVGGVRMTLKERVASVFPQMVKWRRHLHQNPELSFQEKMTSRFVADRLTEMGIAAKEGVGGYGVVGTICGSKPGRTVALRADMDALPIDDEKKNEYASKQPGVMHACGHDAHTAALLGAARILHEMRDELSGNVKLLFQPAEEISPGGALPMIRDGALSDVDVVYGVHLWTPFPVGMIASRAGALMAAADEFVIEIKGRGGHGGLPHDTVDSVLVGAHLVVNLQTIVSRSINPVQPGVVSIGSFHAGKSFNVIPDSCSINGTVRAFDEETRQLIQDRLDVIVQQTCSMFGAAYELDYKPGYPPVVNDAAEYDRFVRVASLEFGTENVSECPLIMAGEDFSYYLREIPGCFLFVGAGNEEKSITAPHHHPRFDIDEDAMTRSTRLLVAMALDYLS
jgi:amidohydrolase